MSTTQCSPRAGATEGNAGGWMRQIFYFSSLRRQVEFMLFRVKGCCIFQHEEISYIKSLFDVNFGHLCMRPQQIWGVGTCIFAFCFVEGPTRARCFESDDFAQAAMLREKNLEQQADDDTYICGGSCSLSTRETQKKKHSA